MRSASWLLSVVLLALPSAAEDLSKRYKATVDFKEPVRPVEWTCSAKDVWTLTKFQVERDEKLRITAGAATVTFGVKDSNAIWAVIVPKEPATISGELVGSGERATSILLRFNPRIVGDLFPAATVGKNGPEDALLLARRLVAHKLVQSGFNYDGFPIVQKRGQIVVDCEIEGGTRRVFYLDSDQGAVTLDPRLGASPLPVPVPIDKQRSIDAFEQAWKEFDGTFAKFSLRPDVDWDVLHKRYRPLAERCTTTWETATTIALLVEHLRDLHTFVKCGDEWMPRYWRFRPQNGVMISAKALVGELHDLAGTDVRWARTPDGIGYVQVNGVGSDAVPGAVDVALDSLADTWGLVLDLRFNGGGATDIAAQVAGRFTDKEHVYAVSFFRAGTSKRTQLGSGNPRSFAPRGGWQYRASVVVLLGQKCMSSGEELALMMVQCPQVVTLGDHTAGSSAAPKSLDVGDGIVVNVPRWNDCDAAGRPYEDVGVVPKLPITAEPEAFSADRDPVLSAGLAELRKTPTAKRKPGKP